jgi:hypothetical protein
MAEFFPIKSSGPREPDRQRPIPLKIKTVCHFLVWGRDDADPNALPLDLIAACAAAGVKPFVMRRYLDRPAVIAHLRAEHRKFREVVCCGNTAALRRVRDTSPNGMAIVASVRALDGSQSEDARRATAPSPGIVLNIHPPTPIVEPKPLQIINVDEQQRTDFKPFR